MTPTIGVGITTYNRPEIFEATWDKIIEHSPPRTPIVVVDDASINTPEWVSSFATKYHRFDINRGVAAAKNKCLELLADLGVEHMFLFDDDTYPIRYGWWQPYVESPEPHLMYQFPAAPAHWQLRETYRDEHLVAYDRPRGCMLYVERRVIDTSQRHRHRVVGGMHLAFGRHGGEHENWSRRIHAAGWTSHPFADITGRTIECLDETRSDISSLPLAARQQWGHVDSFALPPYAEYREQAIPVLVPYRADGGHRDEVWSYLNDWYWGDDPDSDFRFCTTVAADVDTGDFNRSAAINQAARDAGNWDVAVIADADTWVPRRQLDKAVQLARRTGKLVSALSSVIELTEDSTLTILQGHPVWPQHLSVDKCRTDDAVTQSSIIVVPRVLWERIGGFDEKFVGWGGEDNAFWQAARIIAGPPLRIDGAAFHLWHPSTDVIARKMDPNYRANLARWQAYAQATTLDELRQVQAS